MREILLLTTIILGQLAPNSHILTKLEDKLRLAPNQVTVKDTTQTTDIIIVSPTKKSAEDYISTSQAVYSIDTVSNTSLTSKNIENRLQIASLTKLMTAYVILREETNLDKTYKVTGLNPQIGDSTMGLSVSDEMTIRDLLAGLLIPSGSDAAQTLAIGNAGSVDAFVKKMNNAASKLKLTNTHFANPVGWDDINNYSSAKDITELGRILLRDKTFSEIVKTKNTVVETTSGRKLALHTTNQLLYQPGYIGVKTGYTFGAGECLMSLYVEGETQILTTVVGSRSRFYETEDIKGWILTHFSW
jgi:D-alanyl-D-alanine carboxypeptidase